MPSAGAAARVPGAAADACRGARGRGPLAWYADDYPAALACARATSRPIVLDLWAPWCHTCLSMKHTVLLDPALEPLADRFVWLELDTDKEQNAAALAKFPPRVWPTFYVIGPDESVQASYLGAASVTQFRTFVAQGEASVLARATDLAPDSPLRLVRDGDRAMAQGEWTGARTAYGQAVAKMDPASPRRPDVLVSLIAAYYRAQDYPGCVAVGRAELDNTGRSASVADFLYYAHACAGKLAEAGTTGAEAGAVVDAQSLAAFRKRALARLTALIDDHSAPLSLDDRSEAMRIARGYHEALGDRDGARQLAERQRAFLVRAAKEAPTPFAAMTYNWPLAEVTVYLGRAAELIEPLEASIAALPREYDPPYRLAWVHYQLGQHEQALARATQALELGYGPRKARIHALIADIHKARGDRAAERAARQAVVELYRSLPEGQKQPAALAEAEKTLAALPDPAAAKR